MTSPVVMMPLNQDLMAANLTVEQLQTFQHVDNVVEVQLQPVPAPPQSTTVVDSSFFDRVTNMMNTFDKLVPLLTNLGSDRRSPTAGPSDIVNPNPIARVPDSAPQGPVVAPQSQDVAPRPSSASSEPRASSSGFQQWRQDKFASPRGQPNKGDKSRGSRHASPSLQHHLRRQLDNAKEIVDLYHAQSWVPPDQARYDLEMLQDHYDQLSIALEESLASTSFHSHGPSPTSHGIASPSVDPLAPLRGSPGLDRPRSPYRFSSRSDERYEQRVAYSDAPAHRRRPRSRESHPSRELDFPSKSPSPHHSSSRDRFSTDLPFQRRSTSRRSSSPRRTQSPTKRRVASRRTPSPAQRRVASRRTPSPAQRHVASRRTPSPAQRRVASRRTPSPVQRRVASRRTLSPTQRRVASRLTPSHPRGHLLLRVWQAIQAQDLALPGDPFLGILVLRNAPPGNPSLQREVPLHLKDNVMRRETQSPLHLSTHHEPLRESPRRRDPIHGLLLLARLLLREKRRRLMKSPFQLRSRPWWIS